MYDNQIFKLIDSVLQAGLTNIGQNIASQQGQQPTQEGINTEPTIYYWKIGPDQNIGFPERVGVQGKGQASFRGSITGTTLTVNTLLSGEIDINQLLTGNGIGQSIIIASFGTGTGGVGTYILNQSPGAIALEIINSQAAWVYTEVQQKSSLFQIMALATQDPAATESLTASDIANLACYVMQSVQAIQTLEAQGVGILRIPQVRNPYFSDDRERYEAAPSFDFTLTHKQTIITTIPIVTETEFQILDV